MSFGGALACSRRQVKCQQFGFGFWGFRGWAWGDWRVVLGVRFQVLGFGFRISDFEFRVSGRISAFGIWVSSFGFRASGSWIRV